MEVVNYKCDICGKSGIGESFNSPLGWFSIHKSTENTKDFWHDHKDICAECAVEVIELLESKKGGSNEN